MTVLRWRLQTRAALLHQLNRDFTGIGIGVEAGQPIDEPTAEQLRAWHLEDARLAVPLSEAADSGSTTRHYRHPHSVVWHTRRECSAFPRGECVELVGEPLIGRGCAECRSLSAAALPLSVPD